MPDIVGDAASLERSTQRYWRLSRGTHGIGEGADTTTASAIKECNQLASVLGPHRLLRSFILSLSDSIISGGRKKRKKKPVPIVILRKSPARH